MIKIINNSRDPTRSISMITQPVNFSLPSVKEDTRTISEKLTDAIETLEKMSKMNYENDNPVKYGENIQMHFHF